MIGRVHVVDSDVLISKNSNYLLGQMHSAFSHNGNIFFAASSSETFSQWMKALPFYGFLLIIQSSHNS